MLDPNSADRRKSVVSAAVILVAALILFRAAPIAAFYGDAFRAALGLPSIAAVAVLCGLGLFVLATVIRRAPGTTVIALGLLCLILIMRSRNFPAFLAAAGILGATLIVGDVLARLLRGQEAVEGELPLLLAAGAAGIGLGLFLLGEAGLAKAIVLWPIGLAFLLVRRRRLPALWNLVARPGHQLRRASVSRIDAFWIAIVLTVLFGGFLASLRPDLSWDALAYHLPQIRDFAEKGRVEPLANLYPATYFWRGYDTFLGLAFMAGGERVVRLVHFAIGLAAFGSTAMLARRLGSISRCPVGLLALASFPAACLQLGSTYTDLPTALFVTAAAAEIAADTRSSGHSRLGGFLLGGALAAKIFAILAAPGIALLLLRERVPAKRLASMALIAAIPLAPWLVWEQAHLGHFLAPYYDPGKAERANPMASTYGPPDQASSRLYAPPLEVKDAIRLPYALTFQAPTTSKFDGFAGLVALLLLLGLAGWGARWFWAFVLAAAATVLPWYWASATGKIVPSIRYLVPVFPLYAAAAGRGLERLTDDFRGRIGRLAAFGIALLAVATPMSLLAAPHDFRVARMGIPANDVLSALPSYPLWTHVQPGDRVLLVGEPDRFHCPARFIVPDILVHPSPDVDPRRWRSEWQPLGIDVIVHRKDRRDATALFQTLGDCLHPIAAHGPAALYRVDPVKPDCSAGANVGEDKGSRSVNSRQ